MTILRLRNALMALALGALAACGAGSGSSGMQPASVTTGGAMVTLTDAAGDFKSYIVNVVSIQLKRADGSVVETVPATTQVDFTQLVDLSEVISAKQIPFGNYVSASLTLDYTGATIVVDNGTANVTVLPANIRDGANAPLTKVTLTLQLPTSHPFVVTKGEVANLALDFNLAASNAVDLTVPATPIVKVNPVLTASIVPDATKQLRVRGPLVSVTNTSTETSYTIHVRPFYNDDGRDNGHGKHGNKDGEHGDVVVLTTATTSFALNGTAYTGTAGLTALAALPAGTLTAALGTFDVAAKSFTASAVLAGSSIPGAGMDSLEGTVVARSGNVLTLADSRICHHDHGGVEYGRQIAVTLGTATTVTKEGQTGTFGAPDISVGQHVQLFGTLGTDSGGNTTLDASKGSAQLQVTGLWGQFGTFSAGVVTLNLQLLDGRPMTAFNFAGTGAATAQDATAAAYRVAVPSALQIGTMSGGTPIRFLGFVNPFGSAPPDFSAVTLVNYAAATARLSLEWNSPGVTAPFVAPLSATNVVVNLGTVQSAQEHEVRIGPQSIDLSKASTGVTLVPNAAATATGYAIAHRKSEKIDSYTSFADEIAALATDLNGTTAVLAIEAEGPYGASTGTLSVNHLLVVLND